MWGYVKKDVGGTSVECVWGGGCVQYINGYKPVRVCVCGGGVVYHKSQFNLQINGN